MEKTICTVTTSNEAVIVILLFDLFVIWPIGLLSFLILPLLLKEIFDLFYTRLEITNERIIGEKIIFKKKHINLPLQEITEIRAREEFLGKIFNYGTITICTQSDTIKFRYMPNPCKYQKILNEEIKKNGKYSKS